MCVCVCCVHTGGVVRMLFESHDMECSEACTMVYVIHICNSLVFAVIA